MSLFLFSRTTAFAVGLVILSNVATPAAGQPVSVACPAQSLQAAIEAAPVGVPTQIVVSGSCPESLSVYNNRILDVTAAGAGIAELRPTGSLGIDIENSKLSLTNFKIVMPFAKSSAFYARNAGVKMFQVVVDKAGSDDYVGLLADRAHVELRAGALAGGAILVASGSTLSLVQDQRYRPFGLGIQCLDASVEIYQQSRIDGGSLAVAAENCSLGIVDALFSGQAGVAVRAEGGTSRVSRTTVSNRSGSGLILTGGTMKVSGSRIATPGGTALQAGQGGSMIMSWEDGGNTVSGLRRFACVQRGAIYSLFSGISIKPAPGASRCVLEDGTITY